MVERGTELSLVHAHHDDLHQQHLVQIHRLENEADELFNLTLATLYDRVVDVPGVVHGRPRGEVYSLLEKATDKAERVAISSKESPADVTDSRR